MFCAPCIEITMRSIANRTIGKVLFSIKMPNLRNVSFMVGSPSIENCRYYLYETTPKANISHFKSLVFDILFCVFIFDFHLIFAFYLRFFPKLK
jgi:hypothetical protein